MNFWMILLVSLLCLAGGLGIGMHWGYSIAYGDGYNDAVADLDADNDISEYRWTCVDYAAPAGVEEMPDGTHAARPLSDATIRRLAAAGFGVDADGKVTHATPAGILTEQNP